MATKKFDPEEFEAFLKLLPAKWEGVKLRHALDVRHESFQCVEFTDLARKHNAAIVCADSDKFLQIGDQTADFAYARLMRSREEEATGYSEAEIEKWAGVAKDWRDGESVEGLEQVSAKASSGANRDVYMFFISGAKVRAPAAAEALIASLDQ